ncbi:MAG: succinate dehydrogenase assembly factor 2 [Burkholderiales bacterium]
MTNVTTAWATGIFSGSAAADDDAPVDERALSKLRWRCRRGLLENDLLIERFFARHERDLTVGQARSLAELMDLGDNDLLDLLLARKSLNQVDARLDRVELNEVLKMLKGQP